MEQESAAYESSTDLSTSKSLLGVLKAPTLAKIVRVNFHHPGSVDATEPPCLDPKGVDLHQHINFFRSEPITILRLS